MPVLQWAVIEVNLDPVVGSEQAGTRPVLVVSTEDDNRIMPNVTIVPLTSTSRHLYPSEVMLDKGKAGQPLDSIILAHQIRSVSKRRLGRLLGHLNDPEIQERVRQALREHLDLD